MSEKIQGPCDQWMVQSRKPTAEDKTWKYVSHFPTEQRARAFMQGYPVLWPDEDWRLVRQVTTWEVVQ